MPKRIKIKPYFGLGNQVFQYMMALSLQQMTAQDIPISGYKLPLFSRSQAEEKAEQAFRVIIQGHVVPQTALALLISNTPHVDVLIQSLSCRMCYYQPWLDFIRKQLLTDQLDCRPCFGEDVLVCSIRGSEILKGIHPHYMPLPLTWYRQLSISTGLRLVFTGQWDGEHHYSAALRRMYPDAQYVESRGPKEDFFTLLKSVNVVLSISTFSWLAAWLSPFTKSVFLPLAGLYDSRYRLDVDMLPISDRRYRFFDLQMPSWSGSQLDISALINRDVCFPEIPLMEMYKIPNIGKEGLDISRPPLY